VISARCGGIPFDCGGFAGLAGEGVGTGTGAGTAFDDDAGGRFRAMAGTAASLWVFVLFTVSVVASGALGALLWANNKLSCAIIKEQTTRKTTETLIK
jgi:hypothetical protein